MYNFLLPVIQLSTDMSQEPHVYLLEDGLELWLCTLHNSPAITPELLHLFCNMSQLLGELYCVDTSEILQHRQQTPLSLWVAVKWHTCKSCNCMPFKYADSTVTYLLFLCSMYWFVTTLQPWTENSLFLFNKFNSQLQSWGLKIYEHV